MKKFSVEWWQSLTAPQVGNEVEGMVETVLKTWNMRLGFAWHRLPDSKAARVNMVAAQPADYLYRCGRHAGFIEVKGLAHAYRLPKANLAQLPVLHKWELAGSDDVVLVHHYLTGDWRAIDPRLLKADAASHDLREFETHNTPSEALKSMGYFG